MDRVSKMKSNTLKLTIKLLSKTITRSFQQLTSDIFVSSLRAKLFSLELDKAYVVINIYVAYENRTQFGKTVFSNVFLKQQILILNGDLEFTKGAKFGGQLLQWTH